jgi:hypothetical protein
MMKIRKRKPYRRVLSPKTNRSIQKRKKMLGFLDKRTKNLSTTEQIMSVVNV